jgi:transcriptional regulator with XRE-family HTH domain
MDHDATLPRETGQLVRDARKHRNLPRRRVANNAGFSTHELASAERGRRPLTVEELRSLAGSIGVEVEALLPDGCSIETIPAPDDIRIEDLLIPVVASPELEAALGSSARGVAAPDFVERRRVPIASAQLTRAFADLRARIADVSQCCARLQDAEAADDVAARIAALHVAVTALERDPAFAEALARHTSAREDYRRTAQEVTRQSWRNRAARPAPGPQLT